MTEGKQVEFLGTEERTKRLLQGTSENLRSHNRRQA